MGRENELRHQQLRDALLREKMADALDITVEDLRVAIGIDAASDHRKAVEVTPVPPSLSGKTKAELLDIVRDEGVTVEEGATNAEIIDAIVTKRRNA